MRIFSLLTLIIVVAIVMFQAKNNVEGLSNLDTYVSPTQDIESQINDSVIEYQNKLEGSLNSSGAQ